jgi:hypothetical protein
MSMPRILSSAIANRFKRSKSNDLADRASSENSLQ